VLDRVPERPDDGVLADDLVESLRAVLAVERGHRDVPAPPARMFAAAPVIWPLTILARAGRSAALASRSRR
jgi:hypothetical protein